MVEVPIFWKLIQRKVSPKPSICFSNRPSSASGVTSRPVTPVPPVVITTSMLGIVDPLLHLGADLVDVVGDDGAVDQHMAVARDALDQRVARLVGLERAGVGNRQHGDVHRLEGLGFVDFVHARILAIAQLAEARRRA